MPNPNLVTPRPPPRPGNTWIVTLIIIVIIVGVGVWYWSYLGRPHAVAIPRASTTGQAPNGAATPAPVGGRTVAPAKTAPAK